MATRNTHTHTPQNKNHWQGYREIETLYTVGKNVKLYSAMENSIAVPKKSKDRIVI